MNICPRTLQAARHTFIQARRQADFSRMASIRGDWSPLIKVGTSPFSEILNDEVVHENRFLRDAARPCRCLRHFLSAAACLWRDGSPCRGRCNPKRPLQAGILGLPETIG